MPTKSWASSHLFRGCQVSNPSSQVHKNKHVTEGMPWLSDESEAPLPPEAKPQQSGCSKCWLQKWVPAARGILDGEPHTLISGSP